MAKGQKVDELYIGLGLDINDLNLGFETAGKTVQQAISRLNSEAKQVKLKADIDLTNLENAGSDVDKLRVKEEALTRQIELQKQKVDLLTASYKNTKNDYGEDNGLTRRAQTSLLYQQKNLASMQAEMRKLNSEMQSAGNHAATFGSRLTAGLTSTRSGINEVTNGFSLLSAKATAVMAVFATGAGLFNITHDAMMAGESLYKLQTRLNLSTEEASKLGRVMQLAGVNITVSFRCSRALISSCWQAVTMEIK